MKNPSNRNWNGIRIRSDWDMWCKNEEAAASGLGNGDCWRHLSGVVCFTFFYVSFHIELFFKNIPLLLNSITFKSNHLGSIWFVFFFSFLLKIENDDENMFGWIFKNIFNENIFSNEPKLKNNKILFWVEIMNLILDKMKMRCEGM